MPFLLVPAFLFSACASSPSTESEADEPAKSEPAACETTGETSSAEPCDGEGEKETQVVQLVTQDGGTHVIRIQDGGKVIVLPEGGAEIEGGGPIRFEKGGKVIRLDGDVRVLVDGQRVQDSEAKPGQSVEIQDANGKRVWVLRARDGASQTPAHTTWRNAAHAQPDGAYAPILSDIVTDGSRTFWLDANGAFRAGGGQAAQGKYTVSGTDARGAYVIRIEDGKIVSAELDGKPLPKESIEQDGSRVRIKSKDGTGDLELTLPPSGGLFWKSRRAPQGYLGVQTTRPDDALAEHLGLDPGSVEIVAAVVEDGPGARGGLEAHDIITRVDGESPITSQRLGEIVRAKKPGQTISVRVLRKGQPLDLSIALGERKEGEWPGRLGTLRSLGYAGSDEALRDALSLYKSGQGDDPTRWRNLVRPLKAAQGGTASTNGEDVKDLVTRLEEQHRRLAEQLERLEQQQRELQQLEERLRKLGQKELEKR